MSKQTLVKRQVTHFHKTLTLALWLFLNNKFYLNTLKNKMN